ncbi:hypothetical protein GCM10020331_054340 [Ectobacillus funiculus]
MAWKLGFHILTPYLKPTDSDPPHCKKMTSSQLQQFRTFTKASNIDNTSPEEDMPAMKP